MVFLLFFFREDFLEAFLKESSLFLVLGEGEGIPMVEFVGWVISLLDLVRMLTIWLDLGVELGLLLPLLEPESFGGDFTLIKDNDYFFL